MIVRDNEDTIEACLESIYPWVDEIIIIDTGSKDRTIEICRRFGARIFEFPWCDDFSAARNESLRHALGEWIFWMDSDDVIDQEQGRRLRELVYGQHTADCMGYVMQVHCPQSEIGQMTVVDHVKIFRNRPDLRFEHRIHEQILPAIGRAGGMVALTDLFVVHQGSIQTPEVRQRKLERDFRILAKDLEDRPDHPFILFNLGMTHEDAGNFAIAEEFLKRSIAMAKPEESHLRKVWALLVNCQCRLGRLAEAIETAGTALRHFPGDKEVLFRRAILLRDAGQLEAAVNDYQRILTENVDRVLASIDPSIMGHKLHYNFAMTLMDLGNTDEASHHWRLALRECPQFIPAWISLARMLVEQKQPEALQDLISEIPDERILDSTCAILNSFLASLLGDILAVQRILATAWTATGDPDCLDELCRVLTERDMLPNALPYLQQLQAARPEEPSVLHNLGLTLHACGQSEEGKAVLYRCIELAPDRILTICQLAQICKETGDVESALRLIREALQRHPGDASLNEMLKSLNSPLN